MESVAAWQVVALFAILSWIAIASYFNVTQKLRSLFQPWMSRRVSTEELLIIRIQKFQNRYLDIMFSALSCVVSVPFYTAFLPLLFWSGHGKLARQMTLLMAFCDYLGNSIKDLVSAPRPSFPTIRRIIATTDEEENAMEYGFPSSHTLNTACLSGYLLQYVIYYSQDSDVSTRVFGFSLVLLFIGLTGFGRVYLGMHSPVDTYGGLVLGFAILAVWLNVHEHIDSFIVLGQNVIPFWTALSFILLFAYPTPEFPTPSFEFHTAFNGVALGIVIGVHQTHLQFHHEAVPRVFTSQLPIVALICRVIVGIPTILTVKFCSKAVAKWILPRVSNALGIPIRSTGYVPKLNGKKLEEIKQSGYVQKLFFFSQKTSYDVDTGIRFLQYAGLGWSVVDLAPSLFSHLNLLVLANPIKSLWATDLISDLTRLQLQATSSAPPMANLGFLTHSTF